MSAHAAKSGLFITLEGIEGVGKSTCLRFLSNYLQRREIPIVVTREPGGTPLAEKIRELLLFKHPEPVSHDTELLLFFAARAQHLATVIMPALSAQKWVLCDRFTDATYAYQGAGRGFPVNKINQLENWVQGDFRPDLTLVFDAPVRLALSRTRRRRQLDRIELEKEQFFKKVRRCYLQRAEKDKDRYRIIDARKPLSIVKKQLSQIIDELLPASHHAATHP